MPDITDQHTTVGDETESSLPYSMKPAWKQQKVSKPVTVHSSLAAISAVCKEIVEMDQQTDLHPSQTYQKQNSGKPPSIWVPTPKTGVLVHRPTDRSGTLAGDTDDRMIHPKILNNYKS